MSAPDNVRELMGKLAGSNSSRSSALLPTLFIIGALVLAVAGLLLKLVLMRRKAEKLHSQMRLAEERRTQALEDEQMARNAEERSAARMVIVEAEEEIEDLEEEMEGRKAAHKELVDGLQAVSAWDDIVVVDKRDRP